MKIILHEARLNSWFGILTSIVTVSGYSHASIIDGNGDRWDATFERGAFNQARPLSDEPKREIIVIDIPDKDASRFISLNIGRKYDVIGLLLWPWGRDHPKKWYCFEAITECLKYVGIDLGIKGRISAKDILHGLQDRGFHAEITRGKLYDEKNYRQRH